MEKKPQKFVKALKDASGKMLVLPEMPDESILTETILVPYDIWRACFYADKALPDFTLKLETDKEMPVNLASIFHMEIDEKVFQILKSPKV